MVLAPPFEIVEPGNVDTPVLVEVPHAGLQVDGESLSWIVAPASSLARDADLYVDDLFQDSPEQGATLLHARVSRYVVDLNRGEKDYDGSAVRGGEGRDRPRGVIWRLTSDGHPVLSGPLPVDEYERRCREYYRPYHGALRRLLERKRERFGFAVMLCAHSMPSPRPRGRPRTRRGARPSSSADAPPPHEASLGPDLIPGTQGRTSAAARWIDLVDRSGREQNWHIQHDVPYRGGFTTSHYGRPAEDIHVVQLEIARRLYMNEQRLCQDPEGFRGVRDFATQLVARLVDESERVYRT